MTTTEARAGIQTGTVATPRGKNLGLWVLQAILALLFVFGGLNKVGGEAQTVAGFDAIGWGDWFRVLIGALELAGAVAILIPILSGLAAIAFTGLMVGAVIINAVVFGDPAVIVPPAVVGVLMVLVAWGRRDRTAQLWALVTRRPS